MKVIFNYLKGDNKDFVKDYTNIKIANKHQEESDKNKIIKIVIKIKKNS